MKTTIAIDNALLRMARTRASEQGVSVDTLIEEAVRACLSTRLATAQRARPQLRRAEEAGPDAEVERLLTSIFASP